jgi:AraC family transcriptional regulator
MVVFIDPHRFEQVAQHTSFKARVQLAPFYGVRDRQIETLGQSLEIELKDGCPSGRVFGEQVGLAFASYLATHYSTAAPRRGLPPARLEHIDQHLGENRLTVDGLASLVNLSGPRLGNLFKDSVGMPPHMYINLKRMERAKRLLVERNLSIAEIAFEVGFSTQSSFSDRFRRIVGMPPGRFRELARARDSTGKSLIVVLQRDCPPGCYSWRN